MPIASLPEPENVSPKHSTSGSSDTADETEIMHSTDNKIPFWVCLLEKSLKVSQLTVVQEGLQPMHHSCRQLCLFSHPWGLMPCNHLMLLPGLMWSTVNVIKGEVTGAWPIGQPDGLIWRMSSPMQGQWSFNLDPWCFWTLPQVLSKTWTWAKK